MTTKDTLTLLREVDPFDHEKHEGSAWYNKQCPYVQELVRRASVAPVASWWMEDKND